MRVVSRVNYMHYGDALPRLEASLAGDPTKIVGHSSSLDLVTGEHERINGSSTETNPSFQADVAQTTRMRRVFRSLSCRGFSYKFVTNMRGFPYRLRRRVNFRAALVADRRLFYPPGVKRYLSRHRANHFFFFEEPAIAFSLGMMCGSSLYILVLQSDLVRYGPSCVREHFRGWRKVLLFNIIEHARSTLNALYLVTEADVLAGCHPEYPIPHSSPPAWKSIYSGTAADFNMKKIRLNRKKNIQLYAGKAPTYAHSFYYRPLE